MKPPQIRRSVPRVSSYHPNGHCLSFIPPGPRTKGLCTSRPDPAMIFQNLHVGLWQVYKKQPVIRALAHLLLNLEDSVQVEVLGRPAGQPRQCLSPEKGRIPTWVKVGVTQPHLISHAIQCWNIKARVGAEELPEGTRPGKTNEWLHNTDPETKIHDRYPKCTWHPENTLSEALAQKTTQKHPNV